VNCASALVGVLFSGASEAMTAGPVGGGAHAASGSRCDSIANKASAVYTIKSLIGMHLCVDNNMNERV
jgi:hypothetical protein